LCKIKVYRYDDEDYADGRMIKPRGDPFNTLTEPEKAVETAVRAALPNGENVRSTSVYTWANETVAKRLWQYSGRRYLYELEIDKADIRHIGDLNHYSDAKDAAISGAPFEDAVARYCMGEPSGPPRFTEPRVEILVSKAMVFRKLC
jgi:hypothetical protein